MTRINTNVSSLLAQTVLQRSNEQLQVSLMRLSTGLRINSGQDDPSGLIASERLRSDIVSVEAAITNSERANKVIATADSSLGQVSSLLNDIRGLVTESANTGALSDDQIAANQLQIDSSLEALNRISQTTSFQGRRLLDGSLDFVSTAGTVTSIESIRIDQANLGAAGLVAVDVDIAAAATQASVTVSSAGFSAATVPTATLNFATSATLTLNTVGPVDIAVTANSIETAPVALSVVNDDAVTAGNEVATYDDDANTLIIRVDDGNSTATQVAAAINGQTPEFSAVVTNAGTVDVATSDNPTTGTDSLAITFAAGTAGADFNNVALRAVASSSQAAGTASADFNASNKEIVITLSDDNSTATTLATVQAALEGLAEIATATPTAGGDGNVDGTTGDVQVTGNTDVTGGVTLLDDLVLEIGGQDGVEVHTFQQGASVNQIAAALNSVSDATGVAAVQLNESLTLNSVAYGSNAFVSVDVISEGDGGSFDDALSAVRSVGTDIVATVNGVSANGNANTLSVNTSTLDLSITVAAGSSTNFEFEITGGGALFQLGPDVVSNQQARIGIQSVNTARLGGANGRLFQLASGGAAALANNPLLASRIVDEAIDVVTGLRGRLGAFQKTTIDTNIAALNDTLVNLTDAESEIRDTDFASETAKLTRAQILVQSGTAVLAIANSNPQNVLALLR